MHEHEAMNAAAGDRIFQGIKLRVEAKEYSSRHQARVAPSGAQLQMTAGRNTNGRYNARGARHSYNHAHPTSGDGYNPMTPPATVQYTHHSMQGTGYGTPYQPAVYPGFGVVTPPSQHGVQMGLNQMLPTGMFSPTPSHLHDANYGYQGVPFGAGPVVPYGQGYQQGGGLYMGSSVPTIHESGEEGNY